jgi:bifunctional DNA-binding transcriptional regulator/antitoxin component of YhaV-PrlF toxin-antitoxin module
MRLQSQVSRVHKGKEYVKYWIVVPHRFVHKLGWKTSDELEAKIKGGKLVVERDDEDDENND